MTVTCIGTANIAITLSTGASGSYSSRQMSNGIIHLLYQLYSNAARTTVWGNGSGGTTTVSDRLVGNSSRNYTVFGRISALQGVKPGAYVDMITVRVECWDGAGCDCHHAQDVRSRRCAACIRALSRCCAYHQLG